jgi:hypothetical protein
VITLCEGENRLLFDPEVGNIPDWRVGVRRPLHAAPWRDEVLVQDDPTLPKVNKRLAGDFFCMPFGHDDIAADPPHGQSANAPWNIMAQESASAHLRLSMPIRGATVDKHLRLAGPVLYQSHVITGGQGRITIAHHPMARMAAGGRLSFSPKRAALSDLAPQEPGRNLWALNQMRPDLCLATTTGALWDLRDYPKDHKVEDFCLLVEAPGARIGWSVLIRHAEDDMLIILKDARILPVTMLWISNGGRDHPPWAGRHTGVIGIEDGCAAGTAGLAAALAPNRLAALGVPTALSLGGTHVIRHAMISLPRPADWSDVVGLDIANQTLTLTEAAGGTLHLPFEDGFFTR